MFKIASVIVDNSSRDIDRTFDYGIPLDFENIIRVGMRVVIPFGHGNKNLEGYVIEIKSSTEYVYDKIKFIIDVIEDDIIFNDEMINLAYFMKDNYNCTYLDAFKTIMPGGVNLKENIYIRLKSNAHGNLEERFGYLIKLLTPDKFVNLKTIVKMTNKNILRSSLKEMERLGIIELKIEMEQGVNIKTQEIYYPGEADLIKEFLLNHSLRVKKQAEILRQMVDNKDELTMADLCKKYQCSNAVIKALEEKQLLQKKTLEVYRNAVNKNYEYPKPRLTDNQLSAINNIIDRYKNGENITLIHGVTGCGKTEIYLNLVEKFINDGHEAIVLVPEISLTPQTVERFVGRFGDIVAVLHSRLSEGERYDEWRKIKRGISKVVIGARSAIFAPLKNLKLIIIDEEHEYSYKSEVTPKYHVRDIAEYRANANGGLLVMGSATPSLEAYYRAVNGKYNLVEIKDRFDNKSLPDIEIIDMRNELVNGNKSMFSRELFYGIRDNLDKKKQTIIFLNRRGYSTFISCRACGHVVKCSNCDVSLTYHMNGNKLMCHYCGKESHVPSKCPSCGSKYIKHFGAGTEKVENEIKKYFPGARVLRMDMDTTRKKGDHERLYSQFKNNQADILIGTQMISKGMDFSNVTLVGVIAADMTLNLPDFRAAERTFQLITQVAGRAGRGDEKGRVIVQTYDPDHYSIALARNHDYRGFYDREIELRRMLDNPPYTDIIYIMLTSESEEELIKYNPIIRRELRELYSIEEIDILGPTPCHISKIKNNYRWHMIIKGNVKKYYSHISEIIYGTIKGSKISCGVDINPYNMY